ncbi:MAG: energy transducer TonB [Burkholderiaceae bacterium]|jgi:protein TonB
MDFAQQQRSPFKHLVGITFVVLLHILLIYALINGLAHKLVAVMEKPVETKIIQEVKPPPPPEIKLPPPPKLMAPPPPFIPPPEVQIQTPPPVNTISVQAATPPAPQQFSTAPPVAAAPSPAPTKSITVVCPNTREIASQIEFPPRAVRAGLQSGDVVVSFTVGASGATSNFSIVSSSNKLFVDAAMEAAKKLRCGGQGQDIVVQLPVHFVLND